MHLQASEKTILRTLCYADIFNYPLKEEEIYIYLISQKITRALLSKRLRRLLKKNQIHSQAGYFCLNGRERIIDLRQRRDEYSKKKILLAHKVAHVVSKIPTVLLIAVSGSLAMRNADIRDDIDFFLITKADTVWFTRLVIMIILQVMGIRRAKKLHDVSDKICVNMLLDERSLLLPKDNRNLFVSHEISQMKTIFIRNGIYTEFIRANKWISHYLPNSYNLIKLNFSDFITKKNFFSKWHKPFETIAKKFQLWYMDKNKRAEYTSDRMLAFYPRHKGRIVLRKYYRMLKKYEL